MSKIKAVFFDMDGTILNTLDGLTQTVNYALCQCGENIVTIEKVRQSIGNGVDYLINQIAPNKNEISKLKQYFIDWYGENADRLSFPFDGITEVMKTLQSRKIKIAVISNKFDSAVKKLANSKFPGLINLAVGEGNGIRVKPNPDGCNYAKNSLNLNNNEIIYVGDSDVDVITAHNAGIKCIGVKWGYRDKDNLLKAGVDYLADIPYDIIKIIDRIN